MQREPETPAGTATICNYYEHMAILNMIETCLNFPCTETSVVCKRGRSSYRHREFVLAEKHKNLSLNSLVCCLVLLTRDPTMPGHRHTCTPCVIALRRATRFTSMSPQFSQFSFLNESLLTSPNYTTRLNRIMRLPARVTHKTFEQLVYLPSKLSELSHQPCYLKSAPRALHWLNARHVRVATRQM